jgi:iron complex outermembrane receptor protein
MGAPFRDTLKEDTVSWRTGLDYKPASGALAYANLSKGYKAGGFPVAPFGFKNQFRPVEQESIFSPEVGFKIDLLDRQPRIDHAL